jgi:hypothetical protein
LIIRNEIFAQEVFKIHTSFGVILRFGRMTMLCEREASFDISADFFLYIFVR